jgi:hypothetical protein
MSSEKKSDLARLLAPDDIRRGDYVGVQRVVRQYLPFGRFGENAPARPEPFCVREIPMEAPDPLQVIDICLPFLAVFEPDGTMAMLDFRRYRLAQLCGDCARRVSNGLTAKLKTKWKGAPAARPGLNCGRSNPLRAADRRLAEVAVP